MTGWHFDTPTPWTVEVSVAPAPDKFGVYYEAAVPEIARAEKGAAPTPCVVVARVTARPAAGRRLPAGPKGRAKGLMDALHDDRSSEPKYVGLGVVAPLVDDNPTFVRGLAVQVRAGETDRVEYRLGARLEVSGEMLMRPIDVRVSAPNDVPASATEKRRIDAAKVRFAEDLIRGIDFDAASACRPLARCLLIRHRPQRDEDNTWATWTSALTAAGVWSRSLWPTRSPFAGWAPMAVASIADANLPCEVRYEVYGAP